MRAWEKEKKSMCQPGYPRDVPSHLKATEASDSSYGTYKTEPSSRYRIKVPVRFCEASFDVSSLLLSLASSLGCKKYVPTT